MRREQKVNLLMGLYVASLVMSNTIGSKITAFSLPAWISWPLNILFFPIIYPLKLLLDLFGARAIELAFFDTVHVSVGILTVPLMFLITDIIAEVEGRKKAREFIGIGVAAVLLLIIITSIAVLLPAAERSVSDESFRAIFSVTIRMAIASVIAFGLSQLHDVWAFEFWKKKTKGRFLWLRNNLSTAVSQIIDTVVFMFVAFYQSAPGWDAVFVIGLIIPYYIFKLLFAALDTPLAYLGVWWLKRKD